MPRSTPITMDAIGLGRIKISDLPIRSLNSEFTEASGLTTVEVPKLNVRDCFMNSMYCWGSGTSRPHSCRIAASCSGEYLEPVDFAHVWTGSPGCQTRNRKNA